MESSCHRLSNLGQMTVSGSSQGRLLGREGPNGGRPAHVLVGVPSLVREISPLPMRRCLALAGPPRRFSSAAPRFACWIRADIEPQEISSHNLKRGRRMCGLRARLHVNAWCLSLVRQIEPYRANPDQREKQTSCIVGKGYERINGRACSSCSSVEE